jgi:hypothetical protein
MTAADELFRVLGLPSVDQRLDRIAKDAATLRKGLQAGFHKNQLAVINRWAIGSSTCVRARSTARHRSSL